jgi:hypothetical protein
MAVVAMVCGPDRLGIAAQKPRLIVVTGYRV